MGVTIADLDLRIDESPFSASTTDNWVARLGGLPPYIRGVARGIMKNGHSFEDALPIAIGIMRTWARGGPTYGHKSHATPATMAKASKALAQWEAMKGAAHSGASKRGVIELSYARAQSGSVGGAGQPTAGAVASGHKFWGNQHTGSLGKQQKANAAAAKKNNGLAGSKQPSAAATSAGISAGVAQVNAAQPSSAQNQVSSALNSYNDEQATVEKDTNNLTAQEAQAKANIAYASARQPIVYNKNPNLNEAGQSAANAAQAAKVANVTATTQAQLTQTQANNAVDSQRLKEAQVALMGAMKAAGFRSEDEWPVELRDAFVGEMGSSGASNFLPAGPSAKQDSRIKKRLKAPQNYPSDRDPEKISTTHWFEGENPQNCEKCHEPMTSPVHEHVDPHGSLIQDTATATITKTKTLRADGGEDLTAPEIPGSPWHAFEGLDLMHCDVCHGAIQETQHTKGSGNGTNVQEAAESAPGVPEIEVPPDTAAVPTGFRAASVVEAHEINLKNVSLVEGPLGDALKSHFDEQKRSTINRLLGKRGGRMLKRAAQTREELGDGEELNLDPSDVFDQSFWAGKTAAVLEPHLQTAASLAHSSVKEQVGAPKTVLDELGLQAVSADMSSRAHEAARAVTSTTSHELTAALQQGVARGETRLELRARLEHVFELAESARAEQIARTQVTGGYNQAGLTYARHLPEGLVGSKVWLARQDEETRPEHRMANGQPQHLDKPFVAGGVHLDYPGDTRAPLDEWINCRCSQAFLPPGADLGPLSKAAAAYATAYVPPTS